MENSKFSTVSVAGMKLGQNPQLYSFIHTCLKCKKYRTKSLFYIRSHVRQHLKLKVPFDCAGNAPEPFQCKKCNFYTNFTMEFKKHLRKHLSVKKKRYEQFKCQSCMYSGSSEGYLKLHVMWNHAPDEIRWFQCEKCPFKVKGKDGLQHHVLLQHGGIKTKCEVYNKLYVNKYVEYSKCAICGYKCNNNGNLRQHILWKHTSQDEITWFRCEKCPFKSKWKVSLQRHASCKHDESKKEREASNQLNDNKYVKYFTCRLCTYESKSESFLQQHMVWKHTSPDQIQWFHCGECSYESKSKSNLKSHISYKHEQIKEKVSDIEITGNSSLQSHALHKPGELSNKLDNNKDLKYFKCMLCTYKSSNNSNLQEHILCTHTSSDEIQWLRCEKCPFKTILRGGLQRHAARKHGEAQFKCEASSQLNKHVKQFKCNLCTYESKTKSCLEKHIRFKHAPPDQIKWFHCEKCSHKCKSKSNLRSHILHMHQRIKDKVSYIGTKGNSAVQRHALRKPGEKNQKCKVSNKLDGDQDVEEFKCDLCTYKCTVKDGLQQHIIWKHVMSNVNLVKQKNSEVSNKLHNNK